MERRGPGELWVALSHGGGFLAEKGGFNFAVRIRRPAQLNRLLTKHRQATAPVH